MGRARLGLFVWFQPNGDELRQTGPIIIEHAECAVTGPVMEQASSTTWRRSTGNSRSLSVSRDGLENPPERGRIPMSDGAQNPRSPGEFCLRLLKYNEISVNRNQKECPRIWHVLGR